jgi:hypothetical protein
MNNEYSIAEEVGSNLCLDDNDDARCNNDAVIGEFSSYSSKRLQVKLKKRKEKQKVKKPYLKFLIAKRAKNYQDFNKLKEVCFQSFHKTDMYFVLSQYYRLTALSILKDDQKEQQQQQQHQMNCKHQDQIINTEKRQTSTCTTNNTQAVKLLLSFADFYTYLLQHEKTVHTETNTQNDDVSTLDVIDFTQQQQHASNCNDDKTKSYKYFLSFDDSYYWDDDDDEIPNVTNTRLFQQQESKEVRNCINKENNTEYSLPIINQNDNGHTQHHQDENLKQNSLNLTIEIDHTQSDKPYQNGTTKVHRPRSPHESLKLAIEYDIDTIDFSMLEYGFELQLALDNLKSIVDTDHISKEKTIIENTTSSMPIQELPGTISTSQAASLSMSELVKTRQNTSPRSIILDCDNITNDIPINILKENIEDLISLNNIEIANLGKSHQKDINVVDTSTVSDSSNLRQFDSLEDDMEEEEWAMECKLLKDSITNDIDELDAIIQNATIGFQFDDVTQI